MQLVVLASAAQKEIWGASASADVTWVSSLDAMLISKADVYIDFLFENDPQRINSLCTLLPAKVIVNAVVETLAGLPEGFVRFNGWPGSEKSAGVEIAADESGNEMTALAFGLLNKKTIPVPDIPGMIAPRTIAMIVNEAYFAWGEGVSSKADIDTAMQLGTNYPYGPFQWSENIGLEKIYHLLQQLSATDERYLPAPALEKEMQNRI